MSKRNYYQENKAKALAGDAEAQQWMERKLANTREWQRANKQRVNEGQNRRYHAKGGRTRAEFNALRRAMKLTPAQQKARTLTNNSVWVKKQAALAELGDPKAARHIQKVRAKKARWAATNRAKLRSQAAPAPQAAG